MNTVHSDSRPRSGSSNFALLRLDYTRLLVPQQDIRLLDLVSDVDRTDAPAAGVGWVSFRRQRIPVFCLSARLTWQVDVDESRTICALLEAEGQFFGLLCSEVTLLRSHEIVLHDIPRAMTTPRAPFDRLAMCGDDLACVSTAARIFTLLPALEARDWQTLGETP